MDRLAHAGIVAAGRMTAMERAIHQLEIAVREIESGRVAGKLTLGTGADVSDVARTLADILAPTIHVRGPAILFPVAGAPESEWPRIIRSGGAFRFVENERGDVISPVDIGQPRVRFCGDGNPITVTGSVTGTAFTLLDAAGLPVRFRVGSVNLMLRRQVLACAPVSGVIAAGYGFSLAADGYTIATAVAPQETLIFDRGILL